MLEGNAARVEVRSVVVQIAFPLFAALSLGVGGALAVAWRRCRSRAGASEAARPDVCPAVGP